MMKYFLLTLGCQMNMSDGERVETVLERMGYVRTESENDADIIGILACSVRQKAIDKVYSKIHKWNKWKDSRNLLTFISGCVLPSDKEKFLKLFDIVFQMSELPKLNDIIHQYGIPTPSQLLANQSLNKINNNLNYFWDVKPNYKSKFEAFVPIQNGCDKFCSFCAVPFTRGREISRPSDEILKEIETLVNTGYKSITLLGQNVNSYGHDKQGDELSFVELLDHIGKIGLKSNKKFWVYFTSPHPKDMTFDVIDTIKKYSCLAKQIHLPMQSGDDHVLIRMNRNHTMTRYDEIITYIRTNLSEATLFTDIIVGFTGEGDEEFEGTKKAMIKHRFNMAYIAKYSPRPGARSYRWEDDIPNEIKKERFEILTEILKESSSEYNRQLVGKTLPVLITGVHRKAGFLTAMTEGKINVLIESDDKSLIGDIIDVSIHSSTDFSLGGNLVKELVG